MLKFYIISSIISITIILINAWASDERLKREGYPSTIKYSFAEYLQLAVTLAIPILNICLALVFIFKSEEIYQDVKAKRILQTLKKVGE